MGVLWLSNLVSSFISWQIILACCMVDFCFVFQRSWVLSALLKIKMLDYVHKCGFRSGNFKYTENVILVAFLVG